MFYPEDVKDMSMEELLAAKAAIEGELKRCKDIERQRAIKTVCDAFNALQDLHVELRVSFCCPECDAEDDIDVVDYFCNGGRKLRPEDFVIW